ncbi:MAG: ABC transporter ATP-binding protein [Deltaproteobacteria bacterium]|nr:ABC transporter ATP-binding protein [Deltaproteobacteria bacterium]MBN2687564.1 ABC transporter ATP-binding protein [Deltaproteobacteria bacterium]
MADSALRSSHPVVLETQNLTKMFGGLTAVNAFDAQVHRGEICSIIGPNGAGKTTVFNAVTGIYTPEKGRIVFNGNDITGHKPHHIVAAGIARTFQNIRLFPTMTCMENIMAGHHCRISSGLWGTLFRSSGQKREEEETRSIAESRIRQVRLWDYRHELARNIAYGSQRMVEIARALATDPTLLVLDEPSSGLNPRETEELMEFLTGLIKEEDITILLIEHDMNVVMGISDWVIVMDEGRKIAEGGPDQIYHNPRVIEAYLGSDDRQAHQE